MFRLLAVFLLLAAVGVYCQGKGLGGLTFSDAWNSLPVYPIGDLAKGKAEENWNAAWAEVFGWGKKK